MISLFVLYMITFLFFLPIKSETIHQRKARRQIAEFDLNAEEKSSLGVDLVKKIGEKLETQLGRSYERLGHKHLEMADFGTQLEQNKDNLAEKARDIYNGSIAEKASHAYENFQYGYGKIGDGLSTILIWLGKNVIKLGHQTGSMMRAGFRTIGDLMGNTVDKTESFIGDQIIKTGEQVHDAAIDLQRTSHNDSESLRHQIQQTAPKFEQSVNQAIDKLAQKLHTLGTETETAGDVIEHHQFLHTFKQAYNNFE